MSAEIITLHARAVCTAYCPEERWSPSVSHTTAAHLRYRQPSVPKNLKRWLQLYDSTSIRLQFDRAPTIQTTYVLTSYNPPVCVWAAQLAGSSSASNYQVLYYPKIVQKFENHFHDNSVILSQVCCVYVNT